jgi:hypothetical protein
MAHASRAPWLRKDQPTVAEVAVRLGYESEAAFAALSNYIRANLRAHFEQSTGGYGRLPFLPNQGLAAT